VLHYRRGASTTVLDLVIRYPWYLLAVNEVVIGSMEEGDIKGTVADIIRRYPGTMTGWWEWKKQSFRE
jgi:hypothetical protein